MKSLFLKAFSKVLQYWKSSTSFQKFVILGLAASMVFLVVVFGFFTTSPSSVRIFGGEIADETLRDRIATSLDSAGVDYTVGNEGKVFYVDNAKIARKARTLLFREGLVIGNIDPWDLFNVQRWTTTRLEQSINLQRSLMRQLELHLRSLDDVDNAQVVLNFPHSGDRLFTDKKDQVTASVILTLKPGSDMASNERKVQGIVKLVQFAVPDLRAENIAITDTNGVSLNDYSVFSVQNEINRVNVELERKGKQEKDYKDKIMGALSAVVSVDRVKVMNVEYEVNTDHVTKTDREITPIVMVQDNPLTPYSELQIVPNVLASKQSSDIDFQGSGFNPEGPPGQEGQTPPAYQDLQSATGLYKQMNATENYVYNQVDKSTAQTPWKRERISVSVAIDGTWEVLHNQDGTVQRDYKPVSDIDLEKIRALVRAAIGYDPTRGDQVTVEGLQFDRREQFISEDIIYKRRRLLTGPLMIWGLLGLLVLFVLGFLGYLLSKERERRRRLREAELARQHQMMREAALRSLELDQNDGNVLGSDGGDRLRDHAISLARERPEDVAQLIRTWLTDEQ